ELAAPLEDTLQRLEAGNAASERLLGDVTSLNSETADTANAISQAAGAIDSAAQDTSAATQALRDAVGDGIPSLNRTLSNLSTIAGSFAGSLEGQRATLGEANNLIDGVVSQLESTRSALDDFDITLAGLEDGVRDVRSDILTLTQASIPERLRTFPALIPMKLAHSCPPQSRLVANRSMRSSPMVLLLPGYLPIFRYGLAPSCSS